MKLELKIIDLLARNRERKFTIREIALSLKEYYSFVHRIVNALANQGVIQKEKAGKAYLCSLNAQNEKARALLALSEIERKGEWYASHKELKLILEDFVISIPSGVHSIILFGSYAKGSATKESDIDILLITESKSGIDKVIRDIYAKYGKEIHTIIMTEEDFKKQKEKALIKEIIKDHYILLGAEIFASLVFK